MTLPSRIRAIWPTRPLLSILLVAALFRVLAAIFAKGYGMVDDHFAVIEVAQRWVNGHHDWLGQRDSVRSLVYPGFHYILFVFFQTLGITDPQLKMYGVRLLHAFYSLLTVYFGYKTILLLSDRATARIGGLLLATFWLFPFMAVRNLIEFVCIPPIMAGFYYLYRDPLRRSRSDMVYVGVLFGIGFILRYTTIPISGTIGLLLLYRKEWKAGFYYGCGFLSSVMLIQGISDWIGYGYPFASVVAYFTYNATHSTNYTTGPWYVYLLLCLGAFIPPTSLLLLYGYIRTWKRHALLFWPTIAFLIVHSLFPNKQERFMLPVAPLILLLGIIGWREYERQSSPSGTQNPWFRRLWVWFWVANTVLLVLATFTYSKSGRVEPLSYLSTQDDVRAVIIDGPGATMPMMPWFYLGKEIPVFYLHPFKSVDSLKSEITMTRSPMPTYVIFFGGDNLEERIRRLRPLLANLERKKEIVPSLADRLLYYLNPQYNYNPASVIYSNEGS